MDHYSKKHGKQCTLEAWRQKPSEQQTQSVHVATKCSESQEAYDALRQIFGHDAYKSDVQQRAISAILTGFQLLVTFL